MTSFSLKQTLKALGSDLPDEFNPQQGIRSLFPPGYSGSISVLKNYRFEDSEDLAAGNVVCHARVKASGAGKWEFSGNLHDNSKIYGDKYLLEFHFNNVKDGIAHGSNVSGILGAGSGLGPSQDNRFSQPQNNEIDLWLIENWIEAFSNGITMNLFVEDRISQLTNFLGLVGLVGFVVLTGGRAASSDGQNGPNSTGEDPTNSRF
jgi:hypothetical protein